MKIISRSEWTAIGPNSSPGTEDMDGPTFFRDKEVEGISVHLPGEDALFVELNPTSYFQRLKKEDYSLRGFGDISYNLGVTSNVKGVFCLRGLCNKAPYKLNATHVRVLCLLGQNERPTDLLLQNLTACRDLVLSKWWGAEDINSTLPFDFQWDQRVKESSQFVNQLPNAFNTEPGVHVFELIEHLAYWNYYKGKNDGVYGPVTTNAVSLLQADLKDAKLYLKRVDGLYGRYTREAFTLFLKQL